MDHHCKGYPLGVFLSPNKGETYYDFLLARSQNLSPMPHNQMLIHPMMPSILQDELAALCNLANISFWDKERVYDALRRI